MTFENLNSEDRDELRRLHEVKNLYPFPELSSPLYCIQKKIVNDEGKIVGSYLLHLTAEISIVLDPEMSKLEKAKLLINQVGPEIVKDCTHFGIEDVHVFATDQSFADFLIKHGNFIKAKGIALYRRVIL